MEADQVQPRARHQRREAPDRRPLPALPPFLSEHPAVRVRIQVDSIEVLGRALRQRSLDLVVGESTILEGDESIDVFEPLEPVKAYPFVRAGHPLVAAKGVSLRDVLDYPLVQVSRLPPRVLKPLLEAVGTSSTTDLSLPFPAIDCPTIRLAVDTVLRSDSVMLVSLGKVKRELGLRRVVPVFHESCMRSYSAFMKLRYRSPSPAATAFLAALRAAHAASVAEDATIEKRWRPLLPPDTAARGPSQRGLSEEARQAEQVRHRHSVGCLRVKQANRPIRERPDRHSLTARERTAATSARSFGWS